MKTKILKGIVLTLLLSTFTLTSCNNSASSLLEEISSSSQVIDNTEGSLNHDPIYIYNENNVPYDEDDDCRNFVFLTPYLAKYPTGGAVIVFPGGGYNHLSNSTSNIPGYGQGVDNLGDQKEASSIASWYNEQGISVFVCNYRTTCVDPNVDYHHLLSDATRAIKYVRANASTYYVDPNKIGVQGSSAGGHLASMVLTRYDFEIDDTTYVKDSIDEIDAKPNAAVLCYSVISFEDDITHKNTRKVFTKDDQSLYEYYSADKAVTSETSPTFLWCHQNDRVVNSSNTYQMAMALENAGVDCEYYVYDDNGNTEHGVGVAQEFTEAKEWPSLATSFLKNLKF